MTEAHQVTDPIVEHGETPVYDAHTGLLRWVDVPAGDVLALDSAGTITRQHVGAAAAAWRPRVDGGGVVGTQDGFALVEIDGSIESISAYDDPSLRMNDG